MGDHDSLFKQVFGDPTHAAAELRCVLPREIVDALDLDALEPVAGSFVDPELAQRHVDLLFKAPRRADGAAAYVYFLLEHQSEPDVLMPWRVLTYMQRIWAALLREERDRRSLPPIVPLIVHHGASGWTAPRRLHELIEGLGETPALARFVPDFELLLDDLARVSDEDLRRRPLPPFPRVVLWLLRDARDPEEFLAHLGAWAEVVRDALRDVGFAPVDILLRYTYRVAGHEPYDRFRQSIIDIASGQEDIMNTAARSYYQDALEEGRERGLEEGLAKGLRQGLEQLLAQRFGPLGDDTRARLDRAAVSTLQRWFGRVLTASSLDDALTVD